MVHGGDLEETTTILYTQSTLQVEPLNSMAYPFITLLVKLLSMAKVFIAADVAQKRPRGRSDSRDMPKLVKCAINFIARINVEGNDNGL
jgi:hypothetical protein